LQATTDHAFLGHVQDYGTGLVQDGARYYDPALMTFISPDPVNNGSPGQLNAYAYAGNNPVTASDPSGLSPGNDNDTKTSSACFTGLAGCPSGDVAPASTPTASIDPNWANTSCILYRVNCAPVTTPREPAYHSIAWLAWAAVYAPGAIPVNDKFSPINCTNASVSTAQPSGGSCFTLLSTLLPMLDGGGEPKPENPDAVGDIVADGTMSAAALGAAREDIVAALTNGTVTRNEHGQGMLVKVDNIGTTDVDVRGPNGEYIAVGGNAKGGKKLAQFGNKMNVLKLAADRDGVVAQYYFPLGTSPDVVNLAIKKLGDENVFFFDDAGR